MSHMHTPGALLPGQLPGAWYDLTARIGEAQSVATCALDAVPYLGKTREPGDHCSNLIAAIEDILRLMEADAKMIETQIKL